MAVFSAEAHHGVVLNGVDKFVGEFFEGDVGDTGIFLVHGHELADGVEQMGFAKANSAIDKKRVVGFARRLGDGEGGGMGKGVVAADDKSVESISWIERVRAADAVGLRGFRVPPARGRAGRSVWAG